jgi:hypothetical protein
VLWPADAGANHLQLWPGQCGLRYNCGKFRLPHTPVPLHSATPPQVTFCLRLESYDQLQHPLLLQLACRELVLPELPLPEPPCPRGAASTLAAAATAAAVAAAEAAAVVQLLGQPTFQQHSGACLRRLGNYPVRAAELVPGLLHSFPRLQCVGLQANHEWALDVGRALPPGCLPPSLWRLEARLGPLEGLHWLPAEPLDQVRICARSVRLWDAQPPLSCTALRLEAAHRLTVSVEVLWSLEGLQSLELVASHGDLTLRPLPANEPAVWAQQPGPIYDYALPGPALAAKWLRCLAPLFAAGRRLQQLSLAAQRMFLLVHNAEEDANGYVEPGLELTLLSPLPPPPDGAWPVPFPAASPQLAMDTSEAGLAGELRTHVPAAPSGTTVLVVAREAAAGLAQR